MSYDVVVVGAGPVGSVAAREIAQEGFKVLLVEEHPQIGEPVHCSGLVTPRTLQAAGVSEDLVLNRIKGAIVHSPSGMEVSIGGDQVRALVIDRKRFDQVLAEQAQQANVTLALGVRVAGIETSPDGATVRLDYRGRLGSVDAQIVLGTDGSRSVVARHLGSPAPREAIVAIGGEMALRSRSDDHVEVFVDPELTPGWFAWAIPVDGERVRIGLGTAGNTSPRRLLDQLVSRSSYLRSGRFLRLQGGLIPIVSPHRIAGQRTLIAGDAAGSVKPTSGGGIYTGILSAKLAARVAIQALRDGAGLNNGALASYQRLWFQHLGEELIQGALLRRLLAQLTPGEIDAYLRLFALPEFQQLTRAAGDIDFPTRLFTRLLTPRLVFRGLMTVSPALWPRLVYLLWRWRRAHASLAG